MTKIDLVELLHELFADETIRIVTYSTTRHTGNVDAPATVTQILIQEEVVKESVTFND